MSKDLAYAFLIRCADGEEYLDSFEYFLIQNPFLGSALDRVLKPEIFDFEMDDKLETLYEIYLEYCEQMDYCPINRFRFYTHLAYRLHTNLQKERETK